MNTRRITPYLKFAISGIFGIATILLIAAQGAFDALLPSLQQLLGAELFILGALFAVMRMLQAYGLVWALQKQKIHLPLSESLTLSAVKGFYNLGVGGAGLVAQALHGRSQSLFSFSQFGSATILLSALLVSAQGLLLCMSSLISINDGSIRVLLAGMGLAAFFMPMLVFWLVARSTDRWRFLPEWLGMAISKLRALLQPISLREGCAGLTIQVGLMTIRVARVLFIAYILEGSSAIGILSTITIGADLLTTIPFTAGGLGLREFIIGYGGVRVGYFDVFIAAALIDRLVTVAGNLMHVVLVIGVNAFKRITSHQSA